MIARLRRLPPFETAFVAVAVVALGFAGLLFRAPQQAPPDSRSAADSAPGGVRAWYEMLQREGVRVTEFERPAAFLDASIDTLVVTDAGLLPNGELPALQAWVSAGRRLVIFGRYGDDVRKRLELPAYAKGEHAVTNVALARAWSTAGVTSAAWSKTAPRFAAKRGAVPLAYDRAGALVVRYSLGRGTVVAFADAAPFANDALGKADDARLAYAVALPARRGGVVAFDEAIHGHVVALHWWEIVPRPFLVGVLFAALAVLLAFAGAAIRLGPPIVPPRLREPTSREFLDSLAGLLQRGGGGRQALTDAVRSTKRVVAIALGLPEDVPNDVLAARLESAGARAAFLEMTALAAPAAAGEPALLRTVLLAQHLRKDFAPHAGSRR